MSIEFTPWPKISRLFRDVIITEKIDGTNAAVGVVSLPFEEPIPRNVCAVVDDPNLADGQVGVYAQSRKRIITPDADNFGFATWVRDNAVELASTLSEGLHYGEWWGSGIGRGYGLLRGDKRLSLFNVTRWKDTDFVAAGLDRVSTVPVLYEGRFDSYQVREALALLEDEGSHAAPGFMDPEGVITFHTAANLCFKTTIDKDEEPKGLHGKG